MPLFRLRHGMSNGPDKTKVAYTCIYEFEHLKPGLPAGQGRFFRPGMPVPAAVYEDLPEELKERVLRKFGERTYYAKSMNYGGSNDIIDSDYNLLLLNGHNNPDPKFELVGAEFPRAAAVDLGSLPQEELLAELARRTELSPESPELDKMNREQLEMYAHSREIDLAGATTKAQIVAKLRVGG